MPRYREWDLACKVYVGNLGSSASKYEIENAFSKYGPLRNVWVARNPPGFAFVEFEDRRDAEDATRGLDGTRCCGTRIRVEMSSGRSRRDDRRRGGGSGGGGGSSSGGRGGGRYRIESKSTATTTSTRTSTSSSFNKNYKNNITYHNYCSFSTNFTTTSNKLNLISFNDNILDCRERFVIQQFFNRDNQQNFDNNNFSNSYHHYFQHHQKQQQEKPQHSTSINKFKIIVFIINTNTLNTTDTIVTTVLHIKFALVFAVVIVINTYLTIVVVVIENYKSCPDVKCSKRSAIIRTATTSQITTTTTATTTSAATASTVTATIATTRISATSKSVLGQQAQDQHQRQKSKHLQQPSSLIPLLPPQPP